MFDWGFSLDCLTRRSEGRRRKRVCKGEARKKKKRRRRRSAEASAVFSTWGVAWGWMAILCMGMGWDVGMVWAATATGV